MSTAVWIVMCSEPVMRAPASGLLRAVLLAARHQARHLDLGQLDLLAAPLGEREVGDLVVGERARRRHADSVVVIVVVLRLRARSGAPRSVHGGRPGSPDDSPAGPDRSPMVARSGPCEMV